MKENVTLRMAVADDYAELLRYTELLGVYQKMSPEILGVSKERFREMLADKTLEAVVAELDGKMVGTAIFYIMPFGFSGKYNIFLHIFYVEEHLQHMGIGKQLMAYLSKLALSRNIQWLEWYCLDWNESGKQFYHAIDAKEMDVIKVFRMNAEKMENLLAACPI